MTDTLSPSERSARMRLIMSRDTKPELAVRRLCRQLEHPGYRLHRRDLPGRPDIAYIGRRKAIFVHGCFWHGHACCGRVRIPKSRLEYWAPKIEGNSRRDAADIAELKSRGWQVLVVWECETREPERLALKLARFLRVSSEPQGPLSLGRQSLHNAILAV